MTRDTCQRSTCDNDTRDVGGYAGRFCSEMCEVKHDHIKADARDARRAAAEERPSGTLEGRR